MRSEAQNVDVHAVATSLVFDRVPSSHLPDTGQQQSLSVCDMKELVTLSHEETAQIRERYKLLVSKILCKYFPAFKFLQDMVPVHLPHENLVAMNAKSTVFSFPVLIKDEEKYADIVGVLDQLETWTYEIYSKAGLCHPVLADDPSQPPELHSTTSRPDQPASHIPPVAISTDPLQNVKIPCYGDQLTRVRLAGAKGLLVVIHQRTGLITYTHSESLTGTQREAYLR